MYFVSIKNKEGVYQTHKVSDEVFVYIKQLENAVRYPYTKRMLKVVYPDRF